MISKNTTKLTVPGFFIPVPHRFWLLDPLTSPAIFHQGW